MGGFFFLLGLWFALVASVSSAAGALVDASGAFFLGAMVGAGSLPRGDERRAE